jgi:hypothetical protein
MKAGLPVSVNRIITSSSIIGLVPVLLTIEVPCPIPDCGSIVYAPNDCDHVRVDCLDCGAALLTRRGINDAVTLEVAEDSEALLLVAGPYLPAFDISDRLHLATFDSAPLSTAPIEPVRTFWLVTVCNKELSGEPDVGLAVSLGSAIDAEALGQGMVDKLAVAGHGRCTYRARELEVSRAYRASALIATARAEAWRRQAIAASEDQRPPKA